MAHEEMQSTIGVSSRIAAALPVWYGSRIAAAYINKQSKLRGLPDAGECSRSYAADGNCAAHWRQSNSRGIR